MLTPAVVILGALVLFCMGQMFLIGKLYTERDTARRLCVKYAMTLLAHGEMPPTDDDMGEAKGGVS
jgi:hypothetical protein